MAKLLTLLFSPFFFFYLFFQKSHSPCRKKKIFEKPKKTKKINKKMAKLSAQHGQVISPTAYIYIYIYGLLSGPDFRVLWVNKRAGSSEKTCFETRNGVRVFRWKLRMFRNSRNRPFQKSPFSRPFAYFFGHPSLRVFFFLGALLARRTNVEEVDTRETLRNKGFRTDFAPFFFFDPSCCFRNLSLDSADRARR